jgi:small subunit ribosomal protein S3
MTPAATTYGKLGLKVWIFKGEVYGTVDLSPNSNVSAAPKKSFRKRKK